MIAINDVAVFAAAQSRLELAGTAVPRGRIVGRGCTSSSQETSATRDVHRSPGTRPRPSTQGNEHRGRGMTTPCRGPISPPLQANFKGASQGRLNVVFPTASPKLHPALLVPFVAYG